jgi:pimeloyl-ACP methyl ester carboxylesterase
MGGMVISGVAEQYPSRIAKLVYLAALLPKDGDSLASISMTDTGSHLGKALVVDGQDGVAKLPQAQLQDIFCADCSAAEAADITSHYRDEPLAPLLSPVHLTSANWGRVPRYYVYTQRDNAVTYALQQRMTTGVTLTGTATLDTSHAPFQSNAEHVTEAILGF